MVPMNAKMAKPATALFVFNVSIHLPALSPKGEMSTMKAAMCSHMKGNNMLKSPTGMFTKTSVNGFKMKANSKIPFNAMTGIHFLLTRKPKATVFTKAGRKSRPRKTGGFALMAVKVPIITLKPPM